MLSHRRLWVRVLSLTLLATLVASPARAIEIDKYLPADTETLVVFNIKQLLGSALVKKYGMKQLEEAMKSQDEATKILKDLGFNPLKDLDKIMIAGPSSGEKSKGLAIIRGRFDVDKFKSQAEKFAKDNKDVLKIIKIKDGQGGDFTAYEVTPPMQEDPMFIALASNDTILAGASKEYLAEAMRVKGEKKPTLKSKAFTALLDRVDGQQTMSMVLMGDVLTKGPLADLPVADMLAKVRAVAGGFTVTDGIKVEFAITAKDADATKEIKEAIDNGVNLALGALAFGAGQQKELAPVLEIIKSVKTTTKDKTITVKAALSAETLGKSIIQDQ